MKKASEYARQYREEKETDLALENVFWGMVDEVKELVKTRGIQKNGALASILNEIDQKWRSFAAQVDLNPDGFVHLYKKVSPEIFCLWMDVRRSRGQKTFN